LKEKKQKMSVFKRGHSDEEKSHVIKAGTSDEDVERKAYVKPRRISDDEKVGHPDKLKIVRKDKGERKGSGSGDMDTTNTTTSSNNGLSSSPPLALPGILSSPQKLRRIALKLEKIKERTVRDKEKEDVDDESEEEKERKEGVKKKHLSLPENFGAKVEKEITKLEFEEEEQLTSFSPRSARRVSKERRRRPTPLKRASSSGGMPRVKAAQLKQQKMKEKKKKEEEFKVVLYSFLFFSFVFLSLFSFLFSLFSFSFFF